MDASGVTANTRDGDKAKQWYAAVANFSAEERNLKVFDLLALSLIQTPGRRSAA